MDAQASQGRTLVTLALQDLGLDAADLLQLYVDKASFLFPGSDIAAQVVRLGPTINNLAAAGPGRRPLQAPRSRIALLQATAVTEAPPVLWPGFGAVAGDAVGEPRRGLCTGFAVRGGEP